jgi:NTE family protein
MLYGMIEGGVEGARSLLDRFWRAVSESARLGPYQPTWLDKTLSPGNLDFSPSFQALDFLSRLLSPYQWNPFNLHPLRDVLVELIDFGKLRRYQHTKLFVTTTHVRSGKIRIFNHDELSADVLLASACLPLLFQAIEINGETYWDGGYMGNPAIFPLVYESASSDIVLVAVHPLTCLSTPKTSREILNRIHDISFNATLMREMRAIAFVTRLIDDHELNDRANLRRVNFHVVDAESVLRRFGASSRMNCDMQFLETLRDLGRMSADRWLSEHIGQVGVDSSVDVRELFL